MGCETIVQVFFNMLLNIKLYHWETRIYARHKASCDLHSSLTDLTDKFIEVYMGLTSCFKCLYKFINIYIIKKK